MCCNTLIDWYMLNYPCIPKNEVNFVMVYNFPKAFLNFVCKHFIEKFSVSTIIIKVFCKYPVFVVVFKLRQVRVIWEEGSLIGDMTMLD